MSSSRSLSTAPTECFPDLSILLMVSSRFPSIDAVGLCEYDNRNNILSAIGPQVSYALLYEVVTMLSAFVKWDVTALLASIVN